LGKYSVALIPGDGVGPELTSSAKMILQTINDNSSTKFTIRKVDAGDGALAKYGKALPKCSTDIIQKSQVCLKGPVGESAADVVLVLRRLYDLYANVRPARSYPNIPNLSPSVDLVIIRENTEDVYLGWEFGADENTVVALRVTSEMASRRIAQYGFKAAMLRNKKKRVVIVHKANVLPKGDGLFVRTCKSIAKDYPEITCSESYVDTCAMNLIRNPEEFDVILTTNLYGDILSDEAAQVVGGLGLGPAANIGESFALFEPVHGAAFDIAGKGIANPSSILLSIKMMLEWLADKYNDRNAFDEGQRIEAAMIALLRKNRKTKDIGGKLTTSEFTKQLSLSMY